jgi:hypothetical protein
MKGLAIILLSIGLLGCSPHEEYERQQDEEISLYNEHDGLTLPEDMKRELGLQLTSVTDTNAVPESAIIRGAKEDFAYVLNGKHFVHTPLERLSVGDQIVRHGAKDLWMIELLAIRGGEPCCPAD